ncbi:sec-independent translocase [Jatrophihabitans sp. DSM 45814]
MFNIGPFEFVVLAAVALMVFGPDKLPQLTKDAARMLRTMRDMAQGARSQLTNELGPEFANFDLNSLNPKTAIRNALLSDDADIAALNPKEVLQRALRGEDEPAKPVGGQPAGGQPGAPVARPSETPLAAGEAAPYDSDAT